MLLPLSHLSCPTYAFLRHGLFPEIAPFPTAVFPGLIGPQSRNRRAVVLRAQPCPCPVQLTASCVSRTKCLRLQGDGADTGTRTICSSDCRWGRL